MNVTIDGLPTTHQVADLFAGTTQTGTGATYNTTLEPLGVRVLKFSAAT